MYRETLYRRHARHSDFDTVGRIGRLCKAFCFILRGAPLWCSLYAALFFLGMPTAYAAQKNRAPRKNAPAEAPVATTNAVQEKSAAQPKKRLLVLDPVANNVDASTVSIVTGILTVELAAFDELEVISGAEVQRMMDIEVAKQNLGCAADSCLTELADAFGSDLVVFGNIGRLGELYVLTLNLFETATAKSQGRISLRTQYIEKLPEILSAELPKLMGKPHLPGKMNRVTETQNSLQEPTQNTAVEDEGMQPTWDEKSRLAMSVAGTALVLTGVAGIVVGSIPWVRYADLYFGAQNAKSASDYRAVEDAYGKINDDNERWGRLSLGIGSGALIVGSILLAGNAWLAPEETGE